MSYRSASIGRGLTMIELLIALALVGVLAMVAAPSFREMIAMQRLRGANAQLVTDLQYARAEAVTRGRVARINLGSDASQTCYVIYFATGSGVQRCNCLLGAGAACGASPNSEELRTVSLPRSAGVSLVWPAGQDTGFGYYHLTGGLVSVLNDVNNPPALPVQIEVRIDDDRRLQNTISQTGRPTVCAPNPQRMQVTGC